MDIIPKPQSLTLTQGVFHPDTAIVLDLSCSPEDLMSAQLLKEELISSIGICRGITRSGMPKKGNIILCNKNICGEGYCIKVEQNNAYIIGDSSKGVFYGVQTMRQIVRQNALDIPCLEIEDSPSVDVRGLYFDITRGRIPTKEYMFELIDRLSFYKINHLQFYIEHCFLFEGFSEVCTGKGTITPEEILEIDEYAFKRHIEVVPSIATFGHLYEVLQTKSFNKYCELENYAPNSHRWRERQRHHIIDVSNREAHEFIKNLIDQYYPLFRSKKFNICLDEPFDLCKGRSSRLAEEKGANNLYSDFLDELHDHLSSKGITTMFWGDACLQDNVKPRCLENDYNIIMGYGSYDDVVPPKRIDEIAEGAAYKQTKYMLCTTHSYSQILNPYGLASRNIKTMAALTKKYHYDGFLNTEWGDEGHTCHLENSMPLIILGADLGWNYNQNIDMEAFMSSVSRIEYGDASGELVSTVYKIAETQAKHVWDGRMPISFLWIFFLDLIFSIKKGTNLKYQQKWIIPDVVRQLEETEERVREYKAKLVSLLPKVSPINRRRVEVFINSAEGVRVISNALLALLDYPGNASPKRAEELELWLMDYCEIWRRDNKESELHEIVSVIAQAASYLRDGN